MTDLTPALPPADIIVWRRGGYEITLTEDGPMLRVYRERTFEPAEVAKLIELFSAVSAAAAHGDTFTAPKPPTREELGALAWEDREREAARRAQKAIAAEFDTTPTTSIPF